MPLLLLLPLLALDGLACGGSSSYVHRQSYRARQQRNYQRTPQPMVAQEAKASRSFFSFGSASGGGGMTQSVADSERPPSARPVSKSPRRRYRSSGGSGRYKKAISTRGKAVPSYNNRAGQVRHKAEKAAQKAAEEGATPMVVYLGYLKLRVKRRLDAVDRITRMTEKAGGYIDSLGQRVIVLRIPASDFHKVMAAFAQIGEVVDRRVKALDVSKQFTDLGTRLAIAKRSRERLLALLKTVKDVQQRLSIVNEIKRLSERIEGIESTLSTLRNLADYFTITIELDAVVRSHRQMTHRSPFPWVRRLAAHRLTIRDGNDDVKMTMPKGFVLFEKDDDFRAQSADTSMLRAGRLDNEPRGTSKWWSAAVHHEMDGRDEALVDTGSKGLLEWRVYRNKDVRPRYWLIAVHADGEDLYVVEVFFPNADAWQAHKKAVVEALATFGPK